MEVKLQTFDHKAAEQGVKRLLERVVTQLEASGDLMSRELQDQTREHLRERFPGSKHWDPSKVSMQPGSRAEGRAEGSAEVAIPGASRAYHDVTIKPVNRQAITIPLHQAAFGKKPSDVSGLFVVKSKNGHAFLAKNEGKELQLMWLLAKRAFQKQDSSLLPSDESLADAILKKVSTSISQKKA